MLKTKLTAGHYGALILIGIFFLVCYPAISTAAGSLQTKVKMSEKINLTVGKSFVLESQGTVKRVAVAQPAVVEAVVLSPRQIYLNAKMPGITNITLWGPGDTIQGILDVEVMPDMNRLKETLYKMFPGEKGIFVNSTHDYLTLSGSVSSAAAASQVLEIARAYAPGEKDGKPRLINMLEVGGVHQVMLEVRVSEMSRSLARRLGFNFAFISASGQQFGISLLNSLTSLPGGGFPSNSIQAGSTVNGILRFLADGATWTVFIDAMKENGLLKVLAEPTLMTLSGKEARFLAGGEFPIPVPQSTGGGGTTVTIEYKPFGVGLAFTPVVLSSNKISMQVAPEVSDLDFSTGTSAGGFPVPAISTRRVATTVELADGQSFAIAGLLKEDIREVVNKYPVLGDLPVLGALFRSSTYQKRESELIIIVTPHLVKPLDLKKQTLPTDQFVDPNDFEFYLLGALEGAGEPKTAAFSVTSADLSPAKPEESKFGHIIPQQ